RREQEHHMANSGSPIISSGGLSAFDAPKPSNAEPGEASFDRHASVRDVDFTDCKIVAAITAELTEREIHSAAELEVWVRDIDHLRAALNTTSMNLMIAYSVNTADKSALAASGAFEREILNPYSIAVDAFNQKLLDSPFKNELSTNFSMLLMRKERDRHFFRETNIVVQEAEHSTLRAFSTLRGKWGIEIGGQVLTKDSALTALEQPDREAREELWRATRQRFKDDIGPVGECFSELVALRTKMAHTAGEADYCAYDFKSAGCEESLARRIELEGLIAEHVVPVLARIRTQQKEALGVKTLRPWDLEVHVPNADPLRPFPDVDTLITGVISVLDQISPEISDVIGAMNARGDLDLETRPNKRAGAATFPRLLGNLSFIFANTSGSHGDARMLIHEGAHAFHSRASRKQDLAAYRTAAYVTEFAEGWAIGLELLATNHYPKMYSAADALQAKQREFIRALELLCFATKLDTFERFCYTNPEATPSAREDQWVKLDQRFNPGVDWSGLESERRLGWQEKDHIFSHALAYGDYITAQLTALQVYQRYRLDQEGTLQACQQALAHGNSLPLAELYKVAGIDHSDLETVVKGMAKVAERALEDLAIDRKRLASAGG
ncbi:M3 family metallopeptidase, partial [Oligoflexia bacterium]|nr:M3 family metallopeptidase [Oligoflexia bacterium]